MKKLLCLLLLLPSLLCAQEQDQENQQQDTEQTESEDNAGEEAASEDESDKPVKYEYVLPIELRTLQQLDIQEAIDEENLLWLDSEDGQALSVMSQSTVAKRKGVAVLLPDWTHTQLDNTETGYLREALNDLGWATIALLPPKHLNADGDNLNKFYLKDSDKTAMSDSTSSEAPQETTEQPGSADATETDDSTTEPEEEATSSDEMKITVSDEPAPEPLFKSRQGQEMLLPESIEEYEKSLMALLDASIKQSRKYPGYFMVVAEGTSAAWLNKMLKARKIGRPHAVVSISPYLPDYKLNKMVAEDQASSGAPTLDIFSKTDNRWALSTVDQRLKASKKVFKLNYRQREIFGLPGTVARNELLKKEIYGWLVSIGMM